MAALTGNLVIASSEAAVHLILDGIDKGEFGPGIVRGLSVGAHRLELVGDALYFFSEVSIAADSTIELVAKPLPVGSLELRAPEGVAVSISGKGREWKLVGGGLVERIPEGSYTVRAGGGDFYPVSVSALVTRGRRSAVEPYQGGMIAFSGSLVGVTCSLDGGASFDTTKPAENVESGTHTIVLTKAGYRSVERKVDVALGKRTEVDASFEKLAPGSIALRNYGENISLAYNSGSEGGSIEGRAIDGNRLLFEGLPAGLPIDIALIDRGYRQNIAGLGVPERGTLELGSSTYASWLSSAIRSARDADAKALAARRGKTTAGILSLAAGLVGAAATGATYYLGAEAAKTYTTATSSAAVAAARSQVELYGTLFGVSAGLGGLGLGLSPILFAGGPDAQAIERSVKRLDEQIKALGE